MQRKLSTVEMALVEKVDHYIEDLFVPSDASLDAVLKSIVEEEMPPIQVSPCHGKLLYLLSKMCGARRILELGALAGYSSIWLARALPDDGRLISLEVDAEYAEITRRNVERAGLAHRVEVRVGHALQSLDQMTQHGEALFDLAFIDADKENYPAYLKRVVPLIRRGGVIVADNVVRRGDVVNPSDGEESTRGAAAFNKVLAAETRLESIILQTVGVKGHDGMAVAIVK